MRPFLNREFTMSVMSQVIGKFEGVSIFILSKLIDA